MSALTRIAAPAIGAALALAASMPAQARDMGPGFSRNMPSAHHMNDYRHPAQPAMRHGHFGFQAEIDGLRRDIDRAAAMRRISWREAASLRADANRIDRLFHSYARGGLNSRERASLDRNIAKLRTTLRFAMHDSNRRRG